MKKLLLAATVSVAVMASSVYANEKAAICTNKILCPIQTQLHDVAGGIKKAGEAIRVALNEGTAVADETSFAVEAGSMSEITTIVTDGTTGVLYVVLSTTVNGQIKSVQFQLTPTLSNEAGAEYDGTAGQIIGPVSGWDCKYFDPAGKDLAALNVEGEDLNALGYLGKPFAGCTDNEATLAPAQ